MKRIILTAALAVICMGCEKSPPGAKGIEAKATEQRGAVDEERLANIAREPGQWLTGGRDEGGTYFSPLTQINAENVAKLGFAWDYKVGTTRGLEATPIVVDGVMYTSGVSGRVYALDAETGREIWTYDPQIDGQYERYACCDSVNRGVAVWKEVVYVGSLDGYLHAIDAASGKRIWKVDTLIERGRSGPPYSVPGAPQIAGDLVVIGNAGADFDNVRGYVTAYDLRTGAQKWRFFTVPRDPKLGPQDQPHLVEAAKTWDPRHRWEAGGGATVWDGIAYDPQLQLVYIGTGNASPYNIKEGGREGGAGLYSASILAIHAKSGELAWYLQTVPGDLWDYDNTQKMILTDLIVAGRTRKVLMQAAKNGFFYVLDRASGEVISAKPFAFVNWTKGLDQKTGQPTPNPDADYNRGASLVFPSMAGAHSWFPMAYNPGTGLVYIPTLETPMVFFDFGKRPLHELDGTFTVMGLWPGDYDPAPLRALFGPLPSLAELEKKAGVEAKTFGVLRAYDPVNQKIVWEQPFSENTAAGVMTTAGNLVFQGDPRGVLSVYAADTGKVLKQIELGTGIIAAPMTYTVKGTQYVALMAGHGGAGQFGPFQPQTAAFKYGNAGRIIALKLDGSTPVLPPSVIDPPFAAPEKVASTEAQRRQGELLFYRYCSRCHVFGRGLVPDLRRMSPQTSALFEEIVLRGAYVPKGMGRFDDVLNADDVKAIRAYITEQARLAYDVEQKQSGADSKPALPSH
jgi:quinohemoprotein ethanol dehydrogenase